MVLCRSRKCVAVVVIQKDTTIYCLLGDNYICGRTWSDRSIRPKESRRHGTINLCSSAQIGNEFVKDCRLSPDGSGARRCFPAACGSCSSGFRQRSVQVVLVAAGGLIGLFAEGWGGFTLRQAWTLWFNVGKEKG